MFNISVGESDKKTSNLNVKVIGGSGAFEFENSSFLIELIGDITTNILFDCGENSFQYIKQHNINVDIVFISHTHSDHVNGLEKLVFYNYFVKNKKTMILTGKDVNVERYLPDQIVYENGMLVDADMYQVFHSFEEMSKISGSDIPELADDKLNWADVNNQRFIFKGNHVVLPSYGLLIRVGLTTLIITGDTKASPVIRDLIQTELNIGLNQVNVFHDYSMFGTSHNSVHCCEDDFNAYYADFKDNKHVKWYLYHNNEFNAATQNTSINIT